MKVVKITQIQEGAYNGLTKTWFIGSDGTKNTTMYLLHQPKNSPKVGDELDGTVALDHGGQYKFTKTKPVFDSSKPQAHAAAPQAKVYKADPDKLAQDYTLETAKNMAIQRQVAVKGAVDLIVAGRVAYTGLHEAYASLMELLSEPQWTKFRVVYEDVVPDDIMDEESLDAALARATERDQ